MEYVKRGKCNEFERGGTDLPRLLRLQRQGKIDSWAIRWDYQQSKSDSMTIYPVKSLIKNIGYDGSGSHCVKDEKMECDMGQEEFEYHLKVPNLSADILKEFKAFYHVPMWKRIVLKLQSYLKVKR